MENENPGKNDEGIQNLEQQQQALEENLRELKAKYEEQKRRVRELRDSVALRNVVLDVFKDLNIDK